MILSKNDLKYLSELACNAALKAGEFIYKRSKEEITVLQKSGGDSLASQVVTEVDIASQNIILEVLQPTFNALDLALLTEELEDDSSRLNKDYFWCIDPLDGTLPFTEGKDGYAVSIALVSNSGQSVVGVVYDPVEKNLYCSVLGGGVTKNNSPFLINQKQNFCFATDRSFISHADYSLILRELQDVFFEKPLQVISHCGSVKNAINVLENAPACYFKYPKKNNGGGSIWDFAATNCIFKELDLPVYDVYGNELNLNRKESTFMNQFGVVYCSSKEVYSQLVQNEKIMLK